MIHILQVVGAVYTLIIGVCVGVLLAVHSSVSAGLRVRSVVGSRAAKRGLRLQARRDANRRRLQRVLLDRAAAAQADADWSDVVLFPNQGGLS